MATKESVAVLDIGSSKVSVLVGERGVNNTFRITGSGEAEYSGFANGRFYEEDKLYDVLGRAISQAEESVKYKLSEIYVGVPGEFSTSVCRESSISFKSRRRITDVDVNELYESGDIFKTSRDYVVVDKTPVYYMIDDNNRVLKPEGLMASKISGFLCYTLAERKFAVLVHKVLNELGIKDVKFISSVLAESLFLFEEDARDRYVFLIDVGYITTNLAIVRGDGLLYCKTIPLGGGHISADLSECLHIGFREAESLKRKIELSLDVTEDDHYEIISGDQVKSFESIMVHEIVVARLEQLADYIKNCISECPYPYPEYIPVYLTGGGVCYLRGAKEFLSKYLEKPIELAVPSIPQISKPHLSSVYGLLDFALKLQEPAKQQGFFNKILNFFNK